MSQTLQSVTMAAGAAERTQTEPTNMKVVYQCGLLAVVDPALGGKVGGLGTVEAVVEAGVIAEREGHDELPRLLSHLNTHTPHTD